MSRIGSHPSHHSSAPSWQSLFILVLDTLDFRYVLMGRWGPLIGPGKAFDTSKFFIFCGNALGSPYGSASPVTVNPDTKTNYGPEFPLVTIRDDVKYLSAPLA
jgi:homoserine acetyltransferase